VHLDCKTVVVTIATSKCGWDNPANSPENSTSALLMPGDFSVPPNIFKRAKMKAQTIKKTSLQHVGFAIQLDIGRRTHSQLTSITRRS
jgi:hypothetical protein